MKKVIIAEKPSVAKNIADAYNIKIRKYVKKIKSKHFLWFIQQKYLLYKNNPFIINHVKDIKKRGSGG